MIYCPKCKIKSIELFKTNDHRCKNCGCLFDLNDIPLLVCQFKLEERNDKDD